MTTHSSTLARRIPWMEEPGGLQSMGSQRDTTERLHFHFSLSCIGEWNGGSSILAWRIPGTGEPGGLPSIGLHRVEHDWSNLAAAAAVVVLVTQSCLTLCDPMNCNPPGFSVHGILQARILEWIAIPFFRGSSRLRDRTGVSCIAGRFFTIWATGKIHYWL